MSGVAQIGSEFVFVYTTLPDRETAEDMAGALVAEGLAACVNIYPGLVSVYRWNGEIQRDGEVAAFIKTTRAGAGKAVEAARRLHPYDVPAFLVLPIEGGNEDYLAWAREQVKV